MLLRYIKFTVVFRLQSTEHYYWFRVIVNFVTFGPGFKKRDFRVQEILCKIYLCLKKYDLSIVLIYINSMIRNGKISKRNLSGNARVINKNKQMLSKVCITQGGFWIDGEMYTREQF